jgi:hypothetical protein
MPSRAPARAKILDDRYEETLASLGLPSARDVVAEVRTYLQHQDVELSRKNNPLGLVKVTVNQGITSITLGPTIDKGPTDKHFYLESESRLSFGIEIRETQGRCSLVAYRFHLSLPDRMSPSFYRFDLNKHAHGSPLTEPRAHYHVAVEDVRLPSPVLTPVEVLDRIFQVIEPQVLQIRCF